MQGLRSGRSTGLCTIEVCYFPYACLSGRVQLCTIYIHAKNISILACAYARTFSCIRSCQKAHACARAHARAHTHTHTPAHAYTHRVAHVCLLIPLCLLSIRHIYIYRHNLNLYIYIHIYIYTHIYIYVYIYIYIYSDTPNICYQPGL